LRQKLQYMDQIKTKKMTHGIILTRVIVIATSLYHCHVTRRQLDTWQIIIFLKNSKNQKSKKNQKNKNKVQKIEELTRDTPFNVI